MKNLVHEGRNIQEKFASRIKEDAQSTLKGPRWEYEDARGVKKTGTFVTSIEHSGTDVTYVFKGDDGKEDRVSGSALKKAKRIYEHGNVINEYKEGDKVRVGYKGKIVIGTLVRYDGGGSDMARQHGGGWVVDVGPESITVPVHQLKK